MLQIIEHSSSNYGPRTYANAASVDVTIALAVNFSTAGEKCTHKAAGDKYLALWLADSWLDNARKIYVYMKKHDCRSVNIAGNGIYTLNKHGFTQELLNSVVYSMLAQVHEYWPIKAIRSGGQTGVDLAGLCAGYKLGIETTALLPKGFIQRHENGVDVKHTREEIEQQIIGEFA